MKQHLIILLTLFILVGCNPNTPSNKKTIGETSFDKAYSKSYGIHYAGRGVEQQVTDLAIYSEKLDLDSTGTIIGSGTNLYLSDIFLPSTEKHLLEGKYLSDTTGNAYTFLPGVDYDGNISGAYLLNIENGNLINYIIFESGSYIVEQYADTTQINFTLKYNEYGMQKLYEAIFRGIIVDL